MTLMMMMTVEEDMKEEEVEKDQKEKKEQKICLISSNKTAQFLHTFNACFGEMKVILHNVI